MTIKTLIATPETDAALRGEYRRKGAEAKAGGRQRAACPYNGLLRAWWLEGWDSVPAN